MAAIIPTRIRELRELALSNPGTPASSALGEMDKMKAERSTMARLPSSWRLYPPR